MRTDLAAAIGDAMGAAVATSRPVAGGDINAAFAVTLADGRAVFVKHHPSPPTDFFTAEADGLTRLGASGAVDVPEVLAVHDEVPAFLVLSWVEQRAPAADHDERLGRMLAALHTAPFPGFGLERDNYVGTVAQDNTPEESWVAFFAERRLRPLLRTAVDRGTVDPTSVGTLDRVVARLDDIAGPPEPPSLLHGDLWGGNAISGPRGGPVLIDPAVHGGHRETDLAMMRLFGGFSARVFAAYAEVAPLAEGHEDRVRLHQLPPLLVHAILFGGGYGDRVTAILRSYA